MTIKQLIYDLLAFPMDAKVELTIYDNKNYNYNYYTAKFPVHYDDGTVGIFGEKENKMITLNFLCPFCGSKHSVTVKEEELNAYNAGALAQDAFVSLTADEREQIISHICPNCIKEVFG